MMVTISEPCADYEEALLLISFLRPSYPSVRLLTPSTFGGVWGIGITGEAMTTKSDACEICGEALPSEDSDRTPVVHVRGRTMHEACYDKAGPACAECGGALIPGVNSDFCSEACERKHDARAEGDDHA